MKTLKQRELLILLFCLLIGFALRFYTFDQKSLWLDEIYTFQDSRDGIKEQLNFYKENPTHLHPPLFFVLTHLFYPFSKPERDLRIIPLIFGTLSIIIIYFLSKSFSPDIAIPCTLSLTFMAYHISLSQDGRSYSLLLFLGMLSLTFFMKFMETQKKRYLFFVALLFASLFHTSYSSIPFITLSQVLWFYRARKDHPKPKFSSVLFLNSLIILFCLPWIIFVALHYKSQPIMGPTHTEDPGSFLSILYWVIHDWVPHIPLMVASVIILIIFPLFSHLKKNALVLIAVFILPILGLYLFCKILNVTHFVTSRYFINFLPLFFITLYLSLNIIELKCGNLKKYLRMRLLFVILFIGSNLIILPFYYNAEKQDFRGLANYLKGQLRDGDKIFVVGVDYMPGILYYLGAHPEGRYYIASPVMESGKMIGVKIPFIYENKTLNIYHSKTCCTQYVADGNRLWIVATQWLAKKIKKESPSVLKGYFDGSFLNFTKFPIDASLYLFLWDPKSPNEKGIDLPID
jgi:hypothetical protein